MPTCSTPQPRADRHRGSGRSSEQLAPQLGQCPPVLGHGGGARSHRRKATRATYVGRRAWRGARRRTVCRCPSRSGSLRSAWPSTKTSCLSCAPRSGARCSLSAEPSTRSSRAPARSCVSSCRACAASASPAPPTSPLPCMARTSPSRAPSRVTWTSTRTRRGSSRATRAATHASCCAGALPCYASRRRAAPRSVTVHASDRVVIEASGASEVLVHGHPQVREVDTSGTASVVYVD